MKTGYFARPFNYHHKSKSTMTHIVNDYNKPICGYKPHKTMKFQWCSMDINLTYTECKKYYEKGIKILKLKREVLNEY